MAQQHNLETQLGPGHCRHCHSCCEKMVEPAACLELGCRFLYSYKEKLSGRRYIGCIQGVFKAEVDLNLLLEAESMQGGFGGLKVAKTPLPHCSFTVEQTYSDEGPEYECQNQRFFDCDSSSHYGYRLFDLRRDLDLLSDS